MEDKLLLFYKKYFVLIFVICNVLGWYNVVYSYYIFDTKFPIFIVFAALFVSRLFFHYIDECNEEFEVVDIVFAYQLIVPLVYFDVVLGTWIPYSLMQHFF